MINLEHRKLNFIESFIHINDIDVIEKLEKIIKVDFNKNKNDDLKAMSLENFYAMIDESVEQHKNGEVLSEAEMDIFIESLR